MQNFSIFLSLFQLMWITCELIKAFHPLRWVRCRTHHFKRKKTLLSLHNPLLTIIWLIPDIGKWMWILLLFIITMKIIFFLLVCLQVLFYSHCNVCLRIINWETFVLSIYANWTLNQTKRDITYVHLLLFFPVHMSISINWSKYLQHRYKTL